jgi:hypothetical protein
MRNGPGLLGMMARTAVITGTVRATSNAMDRSASNRAAAQQQQAYAAAQQVAQERAYAAPPPPPAAALPAAGGGGDLIAQLKQLAELHQIGALSAEQFETAKSRLLSA